MPKSPNIYKQNKNFQKETVSQLKREFRKKTPVFQLS